MIACCVGLCERWQLQRRVPDVCGRAIVPPSAYAHGYYPAGAPGIGGRDNVARQAANVAAGPGENFLLRSLTKLVHSGHEGSHTEDVMPHVPITEMADVWQALRQGGAVFTYLHGRRLFSCTRAALQREDDERGRPEGVPRPQQGGRRLRAQRVSLFARMRRV